jgi:iron complex outermembrane recepter protein
LSIGALNVFDTAPPNVLTNAGYDTKVHDPRGRVLYVRLKTALP